MSLNRAFTLIFALALSACAVVGPAGDAPPPATTPFADPQTDTVVRVVEPVAYRPQPGYAGAAQTLALRTAPGAPFALGTPTGERERALLARLEHELAVLQGLAAQASGVADPSARVQFRYDWLTRDMEMLRHGIRMHLQDPGEQPRTFEPLRGDYRR